MTALTVYTPHTAVLEQLFAAARRAYDSAFSELVVAYRLNPPPQEHWQRELAALLYLLACAKPDDPLAVRWREMAAALLACMNEYECQIRAWLLTWQPDIEARAS